MGCSMISHSNRLIFRKTTETGERLRWRDSDCTTVLQRQAPITEGQDLIFSCDGFWSLTIS